MLLYQILACTMHGKIFKKSHIRTIHLKYLPQHEMKNLNYLIDHVLYQISDIQDYFANKIENTITFKIKTGYFLEL